MRTVTFACLISLIVLISPTESAENRPKPQPTIANNIDVWMEAFCQATSGVYDIYEKRCRRPGVIRKLDYANATLEEYITSEQADEGGTPPAIKGK